MTTPPPTDLQPLAIRPLLPADGPAAVRCHNLTFAEVMPGHAERSLAHWRWKFEATPAQRLMQMLAVHPHDGVVGVYGSVPLRTTFGGRRCLAAQGVDHCVRPAFLRHGGQHGLYAALGRSFFDRWLGAHDGQAQFVYGLPGASWGTAQKHLGWQIVRDFDITFRNLPADEPPRSVPADLVVRHVERFGPDTDALFARLEPGFGVATVRDSAYLNWRYATHPDRRYVLGECRERASDRLRGIFVYGTGDLLGRFTGYLVDWLQAVDDGDTMTAMLAAAEAEARRDGTGMVCSVWNHTDRRFVAMQEYGYRVQGTPWFLAVVSAIYDPIFFRENWYFTMGDCDFV
jgi:hypothetical protein